MKTFDEILEEGKNRVVKPGSPHKKWKDCINTLMDTLHTLNGMFGTTKEHQVKIRTTNCNKCKAASFIIAVRDVSNRDRIIKFHRGNWKAEDGNIYYCEKCKTK